VNQDRPTQQISSLWSIVGLSGQTLAWLAAILLVGGINPSGAAFWAMDLLGAMLCSATFVAGFRRSNTVGQWGNAVGFALTTVLAVAAWLLLT